MKSSKRSAVKATTPIKAKRAPVDPSKKALAAMSPSKEDQEFIEQQQKASYITFNFSPNLKTLNGYTIQFLKNECFIVFKLDIPRMALTKFDYLGIFQLDDKARDDCAQKVTQLLNAYTGDDFIIKINPFLLQYEDDTCLTPKPLFLRMSPNCFYYKRKDGVITEVLKRDRPALGAAFTGRAAVVVKGVSFCHSGLSISPVVSVCQLLEDENQPSLPWAQKCVLDWPAASSDSASTVVLISDDEDHVEVKEEKLTQEASHSE